MLDALNSLSADIGPKKGRVKVACPRNSPHGVSGVGREDAEWESQRGCLKKPWYFRACLTQEDKSRMIKSRK